jgi:hypothetical protein
VAPGTAAAGLVPFNAVLSRDSLTQTNDWWSYNGYIQDSYSYKRVRINAGLRYDWQQSKYLGGCVSANPIAPDLLPAQCEDAKTGGLNAVTDQQEELHPFSVWSPRMSVTYDLFGNGKTALKATGSYYYETKITLANSLSGLGTLNLRWGNNANSGACQGNSCWNDLNRNGIIERSELTGIPTANTSRYNTTTGVLIATGNSVDAST